MNKTTKKATTDLVVSRLGSAKVMLQEAKTIQETKKILDAVTAAGIYAKRQGLSDEIIGQAHEIRIRALEQLGKMLAATEKNKGGFGGSGPGRGKKGKTVVPGENRSLSKPTLAEIGLDKKTSMVAQQVAELPEPEIEAIAKRQKTITEVQRAKKERKREKRRQENREKVSGVSGADLAGAKFATIVIDPPWDVSDEGDVNQMGRANPDYATLTIDQLLKLPVGNLSDVDCHLYMWITNRSLPKGFSLIEKWGFRYVTMLTWVKPHFGIGNYFRGQTEHVIFGVKGSQMLKRKDASTVFYADRGKGHSAKPKEFLDLVESCSPGPYLEMFGRSDRTGWSLWGESS